jgi:hypothetical protein
MPSATPDRRLDAAPQPRGPSGRPPSPASAAARVLLLQRTVGNRAVAAVLQRNGSDDESDSETTTTKPKPKPKPKRKPTRRRGKTLTKVEVEETLEGVTSLPAIKQAGAWTQKIVVSGPKQHDPRRQLLRHLSTQLYHLVKTHLEHELLAEKEMEVQAMFVNRRFVVATNLGISVESIARELQAGAERYKAEQAEALLRATPEDHPMGGEDEKAMVEEPPPDPVHPLQSILGSVETEKDPREATVAAKMTRLFAGERDAKFGALEEVEALMEMVKTDDFFSVVDVSSDGGCAEAVAGAKHENKIVLVKNDAFPHAEQKLVWALYRTNTTGVHIYGKKRPCAMCTAVLSFASGPLRLNLMFNANPGGTWKTAAAGFQVLANHAIQNGAVSVEVARQWLVDYADRYAGSDAELKSHMTKMVGYSGRDTISTTEETWGFNPKANLPKGADPGYDSPSASEEDEDYVKKLPRYVSITKPLVPPEDMRKKPKEKKKAPKRRARQTPGSRKKRKLDPAIDSGGEADDEDDR